MPTKRLPPLLFSTLLFALPAAAQDPIEDRWFKVELMIFSHQAAPSGSEQWEPTPMLDYPAEFRFLVEPELIAANMAAHPGESVVDEFGRQIITLASEDADTTDDSPGGQELGLGDGEQDAVGASEQSPPTPLTPTPFIALPSGDRTFYGKAAYMQRSGRYRTLFHEAWYQPFADENRTLPIVIDRSGDTGDWPLLQGSVKIYLSRYLHIETDLWLNTDGSYLPGDWQMPAPPLGPPSLIIEEPFSDIVEESLPEIEASYRSGPDPDWEEWPLDPNEAEVDTGPQYPFRHAVRLKQKRRMRSQEVHYLDHPLLGVVVTITPLTEEELEALALAETPLPGQSQPDA
jgi:hypothetical protein